MLRDLVSRTRGEGKAACLSPCLSVSDLPLPAEMGCFPIRFLTGCSTGSSKIKIMTVEGKCYKYDAPMIVKEILLDFPSHVLFHSETVRKLGTNARPLQRTLVLQPGHVYLLIPRSTVYVSQSSQEYSSNIAVVTQENAPSRSSSKLPKVTFAPSAQPSPPFSADPFQILPSPSDGVVRLKMLVSKQQLTCMLEECGDSAAIVEGLLSPLLKEAEARSSSSLPASDDLEQSCGWRPALESIPESPCTAQTGT